MQMGDRVIPVSYTHLALHGHYVLCWNEAHGPLLSVCTENEQHDHWVSRDHPPQEKTLLHEVDIDFLPANGRK